MALNNVLNDEWLSNRNQLQTSASVGALTTAASVGSAGTGGQQPKKIIRNLALKRIKETIPLENKVLICYTYSSALVKL